MSKTTAVTLAPVVKPADADILAKHVEHIRCLGKRLVEDVIEIGRRLAACKEIVGHTHWLPWLKREFDWSETTARNFVRVYELAKSKSTNFADLNLPLSTLYLLAAPSTPPKARDAILEDAAAGKPVSAAEVKKTIKSAKTERPKTQSAPFTVAGNDVDTAASAEVRRAENARLDQADAEFDHAEHDRAEQGDDKEDELDADTLQQTENYNRVFKELTDAIERAFDSLTDADARKNLGIDLNDWLLVNYWRVVIRQVPPPQSQRLLRRKGLVCDPATLKLVPAPKPEAN
jgi:hypothetical protein